MRHRLTFLRWILITCDYLAVVLAWVVASVLRFGTTWDDSWQRVAPGSEFAVLVLAGIVVCVFGTAGLYRLDRSWSLRRELSRLRDVSTILIAATLAVLLAFDLGDVSRIFLALFFPLVGCGVIAERVVVQGLLSRARASGRGMRRILVVGSGGRAADYIRRVTARSELGIQIVGCVDDSPREVTEYPLLGDIPDLPAVLAREVVDEVAICLPFSMWPTISVVAPMCEEQGKSVTIPVDLMAHALSRGRLEQVEGLPVLALPNVPDAAVPLAVKRAVDIVGASALIVLAAPVLAVAALAVLVSDGRPVLFRQRRAGLHGRPFHVLKFRTMVRDAEARLAELATINERSGPVFKARNDPRVTSAGRWLRKLSIDELPQLLNVLRGEMSLVGPRPPAVSEIDAYASWHRRRLSVRPGITGLWQVTARSEPDFDRWVELDLQYIDTWSLWRDLFLLARTPAALIRSPGE